MAVKITVITLKQFETISALTAVVDAVISPLELPGVFVKCTVGNVPANHDNNKNWSSSMVPGKSADTIIKKTYWNWNQKGKKDREKGRDSLKMMCGILHFYTLFEFNLFVVY